uniref:SRCR domain-containing protein n=1 Tax=Oryzias sinensis TaxID=183150 RepID=A0A8C7YFI3_9TELE
MTDTAGSSGGEDDPDALSSRPELSLICMGRFRCGSSQKCVASSARCDGAVDCPNQEDELGCVRLSGRRSVLQVQRRGEWRTVCADNWNNSLGLSACKQLGYSRSASVLVQQKPPLPQGLLKVHSLESQCSSGMVTTLKCLECGSRPRYQTRVVGGNLSLPGQFPWQASLHFRGEHMCGGSVISPLWIVTAAHWGGSEKKNNYSAQRTLNRVSTPGLLIGSSHLHCGVNGLSTKISAEADVDG